MEENYSEETTKEYDEVGMMLSKYQSSLGVTLRGRFSGAEADRLEFEAEWIKDLRQYKGIYDPEVLSKMHEKRCQANLAITRTKVLAMTSRMTDIFFPAGGEKHYSVNPSPVPELHPALTQQIAEKIEQITGVPPSEADIKNIIYNEAVRRAKLMDKEIEDQLNDLKYREIIRQVIHSGSLYGTGILKGPLVKRKESSRWVSSKENGWEAITIEHIKPFCEFVSIWDIYPDMSADTLENADYVFQRHIMAKHNVLKLGNLPGFRREVLVDYLKVYPDGDRVMKNHELDLSDLSRDNKGEAQSTRQGNKYEVLEFWGYLSAEELLNEGVEIDESILGSVVAANVWVIGNYIIKAILSPVEYVSIPYYFYYHEKDETSIFGEGIARIMRDPAKLFNAAARAILDNAAIAAGPYIEANIDLLAPDEDPTNLYPFRVFQRTGTGMDATTKAINVYSIPSHTAEFLNMAQFFMTVADEITTIPRHMYGEAAHMGSAARSPSSLSMLMGAANITVKAQVKNFDDGVTKPFINAMYHWNMDFNPKEDIKGDFEINAEGSSSLITKEVMMEKILQWLGMTNNPVDLQYINRDIALRKAAEIMELGQLGLVKNSEQIMSEAEAAAKQQQAAEEKMFEIERLRAMSSGHVDSHGEAKGKESTFEQLGQGAVDLYGQK